LPLAERGNAGMRAKFHWTFLAGDCASYLKTVRSRPKKPGAAASPDPKAHRGRAVRRCRWIRNVGNQATAGRAVHQSQHVERISRSTRRRKGNGLLRFHAPLEDIVSGSIPSHTRFSPGGVSEVPYEQVLLGLVSTDKRCRFYGTSRGALRPN